LVLEAIDPVHQHDRFHKIDLLQENAFPSLFFLKRECGHVGTTLIVRSNSLFNKERERKPLEIVSFFLHEPSHAFFLRAHKVLTLARKKERKHVRIREVKERNRISRESRV